MSTRKNIIANYIGQGTQALMNFAFIPMYISYLGIEAYGLIGIFALLQSWLILLDMGMKPALGREMARFTAGVVDAVSIRSLLRSVEVIVMLTALLVTAGIWAGSEWLAAHWVTARHLSQTTITHAFVVMGLVTALRFIEEIYISSINGLQRQVLQSVVTGGMATIRALGAVTILAWVSPTLTAFFLWQGFVSVVTVLIFATAVYRSLPATNQRIHFSWSALVGIWRFAAGMILITLLSLVLTQVDKILLSRLMTLEAFGYYSLAGGVASSLYTLMAPITGALYPRFTQLLAAGEIGILREVYHRGAQMVSVLMGSAAIFLTFFGYDALRVWTGNPTLASKTAPLVALLALAALFNGLMGIPYQLQIANGWTSLAVGITTVGVCLQIPVLLFAIPAFGATGAAGTWLGLNILYVVAGIPLTHRRLLTTEQFAWFRDDFILPLGSATIAAFLLRMGLRQDFERIKELVVLGTAGTCIVMVAMFFAPAVRGQIRIFLSRRIKPINVWTS